MTTKIKLTFFAVIALLIANTGRTNAQENKKESTEWAELKAFHEIMAQTFHPSEDGNLKPIRERSGELNDKASKLAASKIPAEYNRPEILKSVKELTAGTNKLNELIQKKGSDEEVKKLLASVHESFHKIVGLCNKPEKEEKPADKK